MKEADFVYASSYIRTLENKMLSKSDFETLLNATSVDEAIQILLAKGYKSSTTGQNLEANTLLKDELLYIWNEMKDACPIDAPIDILLYQNDFHNLKAILKSIFSEVDYKFLIIEPYTISPDVIHRAIVEGKTESLPDILRIPAAKAYHVLARDNDGQLAEIILDKALFTAMGKAAQKTKNTFLIEWVNLNIVVMNMKTAIRGAYSGKSKEYICDSMLDCKGIEACSFAGAKSLDVSAVLRIFEQCGFVEAANEAWVSISAFEKWCDNVLIKYIRIAKEKLFGFETVFGFFIGKQFELQAVRIILSGIRNEIPTENLRERLRDLYV